MDKIDYLKKRKFSMENELTKLASDNNKNNALFMHMQKLKSQINEANFQINNIENNKKLYRVGFIMVIAIVLHNIPEGIATFMATSSDITLGLSLSIAIAMHNIPEGISISVPIYYSTNNKKKAILYTGISAISEPFGALLAYLFLRNVMNDLILGILFSIIAGIMLQISFCELLPTARRYNNSKRLYIFFLIGVLFMLIKFIL